MRCQTNPLAWAILVWSSLLLSAQPGIAATADTSAADAQVTAESRCTLLGRTDFTAVTDAPTQILTATLVAATGTDPAFCLVSGYVAPQVGFELRLPSAHWNYKLIALGNGGWGGLVNGDSCRPHLLRGYACVAANTGHTGAWKDGLWAANNLPAQVDFAYRSVHVEIGRAHV